MATQRHVPIQDLRQFALKNTSALYERRRRSSNVDNAAPEANFSEKAVKPGHQDDGGIAEPKQREDPLEGGSIDADDLSSAIHNGRHVSWKERLKHFHWTWFTLTMSTGGIANIIYNVPDRLRFTGLYEIGVAFFLFNLFLFVCGCTAISLRFYFWPRTLRESFTHPNESLFIPAFVISLATDLINVTQYGLQYHKAGPWLIEVMVVLYWVYVALAMAFSAGILLTIWSTQTFTLSQMTPVWIFPAYPLLMVGPFAAVLSDNRIGATGHHALNIIVSGVIVLGIGFLLSIMIYSAYIYRLMSQKLPREPMRPTMFISVGPTGFTSFALINMGYNFPRVVHSSFMGNGLLAGQITKVLAYWAGFWIWGLGLWFFVVSIGAHWSCVSHGRLHFALNWNGFVFPNTAFVTGTFALAKALDNNAAIELVASVLAVAVILAWLIVVCMCVRAVVRRQILYPNEQDDRDVEILRTRFRKHARSLVGAHRPAVGRRQSSHAAVLGTDVPGTPVGLDLEAARANI